MRLGRGAILRGFELRELRAQRLHADRGEANDELGVVGQCLDADHAADAELRVSDAHARLERHAGCLILVLMRVGRRFFADPVPPPAASVRGSSETRSARSSLIRRLGKRGQLAIEELLRDFVDEPRRLTGLILAEDTAARRAGQDETRPRPGHADVAEPSLLLELLFVVARSRMREQSFLEAGEHDHRKLEPFGAVQRHHPDARVS